MDASFVTSDSATATRWRSETFRRRRSPRHPVSAPLGSVLGLEASGIAAGSGRGEAEEHGDGPSEPRHVVVGQSSDPLAEFRARDGGDLVDHEPARLPDPGRIVCVDGDPEQCSVGLIGRQRADRHRRGRVEQVILDDDHRARLADVATAGCGRPDLSALHAPSLRASMKAGSSASWLRDATATDWSCACCAN